MQYNDLKHSFFIRKMVDTPQEIEEMKAAMLGDRRESDLPVEDQLAIARRQLELQQQVMAKLQETADRHVRKFHGLEEDLRQVLAWVLLDLVEAAEERPALAKVLNRMVIPMYTLPLLQQIRELAQIPIDICRRRRNPLPKPEVIDPMRRKDLPTVDYDALGAHLDRVGYVSNLL